MWNESAWMAKKWANLIGQKIATVEAQVDGEQLLFVLSDGRKEKCYVEGDCCSYSWIEHLTVPDGVNGAVVLSVQEVGGEEITHPHHECLRVYHTSIKTTAGDIVIEYRNSSNGYYGGAISSPEFVQ
jgi:hypothetical protein